MNKQRRIMNDARMGAVLRNSFSKTALTTTEKSIMKSDFEDKVLPPELGNEVDKLAVVIAASKDPVTVKSRETKLIMLQKLGILMEDSIAEQLEEIRDVLLQLPDADKQK